MKVNYQKVITEQPTELKQRQNQQKNITGFRKVKALYLLKMGQVETVSNLSDYVGVHRVTIQRWLKTYREEGLTKLLAVKPRSGRPRKMNASAMLLRSRRGAPIALLKERLKNKRKGFKSYGEIQRWLENNHQIKVNYHTLYHWVRYQLKAKLKVPRKSAAKKDEEQEQDFKKNFQN